MTRYTVCNGSETFEEWVLVSSYVVGDSGSIFIFLGSLKRDPSSRVASLERFFTVEDDLKSPGEEG